MSDRLDYIDAIKGMCIFFVIYWHVTYYCFHLTENDLYCNFFIVFYLPLFFFVSGFVSYRHLTVTILETKIKQRVKSLLLPSVVYFLLFAVFSQRNVIDGLFDYMKYGYWFTFTIFLIFCIFGLLNVFCCNNLKNKYYEVLLYLMMSVILIGVEKAGAVKGNVAGFFSLGQVFYYFPYYVFGSCISMFGSRAITVLSTRVINIVAIIGFIFTLNYQFLFSNLLQALCGIILCFNLFFHFRSHFSKSSFVSKAIIYVGKNSLYIYLLHYFLIYYLNLSSLYTLFDRNKILCTVICCVVAVAIIAISLLVNESINILKKKIRLL